MRARGRARPPAPVDRAKFMTTTRGLKPRQPIRESNCERPRADAQKNKAPEPCGPGAKFGGGRSPLALSRCTTLGALAFAGRVLPDATLRGMRMFRSHGGTVPAVASWNFRVRSFRPVRTLPAGSGAPDVVQTRLQYQVLASAPLPRGQHQLVAGRWPRVTGLTS